MNIGVYKLSKNEEDKIFEIYQEFKQLFNKCELVNKKDILGIGEPGKNFMCYFTYFNSQILVKFKNNNK